jgi:hypothetical protein
VIDTRSSETLLEEISSVERLLKRAVYQPDFVRVHARLNELRSSILGSPQSQLVRARYFYVRAIAYAKPVRINQAGFLHHSATECLGYSLELLESDAKEAVQLAAHENGWSPALEKLQHDCAYEAAVIHTVLTAWGSPRQTEPDLEALPQDERRKVTKALARHYSMSSRF